MAMRKEVPEAIGNQIVGMRLNGATYVKIEEVLHVKPNTARKIYQRWNETGSCENALRTGALKKLTKDTVEQIKTYICQDREHRRKPLAEMIIDLNLPVSERTLKRTIINDIGLNHRIERKTP